MEVKQRSVPEASRSQRSDNQAAIQAADQLDFKVMAPLFAVVAIDAVSTGVILPLLPFYSQRFGATPLVLGLLIASFSLCQFIAAPWLGRYSDRYGRKPVLLVSQVGTLFSLVLLALAGNLPMIFMARILDGLTAGNLSVAGAYAVDHSTPKTRKQAIGIISAAIGTGLIAGPALSALLAHLSLSAPVWGAAALSGLSIAATAFFLKGKHQNNAQSGTALASVSIRNLVSARGVLPVLAVLAAFYFVFSMYISQLALFLNARFEWHSAHFGPREVGFAFAAAGAITVLVQVFVMKWISQRVSEIQLCLFSLALLAAGFAGLGFAASIGGLAAAIAVTSFGGALARPTLMSTLTLVGPSGQQGSLLGLNTSLMAICNVAGPIVAGMLINRSWYASWAFCLAAIAAASALAVSLLAARRIWPAERDAARQFGPAQV